MPGHLAGSGTRCLVSHRGAPLVAVSISRSVWGRLKARPFAGRVLGAFEHACNLVSLEGDLIALALPQVGDGPLNIVVDGSPGVFDPTGPGTPVWMEASWLRIGGLPVALEGAAIWEPCPPWSLLRADAATIADQLPLLRAIALHLAPEGSFLALFPHDASSSTTVLYSGRRREDVGPSGASEGDPRSVVSAAARSGAESLRAGWLGALSQLQAGAVQLAGLGSGLTPAGDDFLAGLMLWAWLAHPEPRQVCRIVAAAAAPRTTRLSAAFLWAAAKGECGAPWHRLLAALQDSDKSALVVAVRDMLARGSTSGADTLAGFLWMGLHSGGSHLLVN